MGIILTKITRITAVAAIAVTLLPGCTKTPDAYRRSGTIKVSAHVGQSTKGSEIKTDNLMVFRMDAILGDENKVGPAGMTYFSGAQVSRTAVGQPWTMIPEYNWVGECDIYFWSYAPASLGSNFSITSESPSGFETALAFDYEVKGTPSSQEDLILAYNCENMCVH